MTPEQKNQVARHIQGRRDFTTIDISVALKLSPSTVKAALGDLGFYLKRFQRGEEIFERWVPSPRMGKAA